MMTKKQLVAILEQVPDDAPIFVRHQTDDAYPAVVRLFDERGRKVLYFQIDPNSHHRNWPERYSGVTEIPLQQKQG